MLALEPLIVERLKAALPPAWTVKGMLSDAGRRAAEQFASVSFVSARVPDSKQGAAMVQPGWAVLLTARRGAGTAEALDAAFTLAMAQLHGWQPGEVAGRRWERLALFSVTQPIPADDGLIGVELIFTTAARYDGQP